MKRKSGWTLDELKDAISKSKTYNEIQINLGYKVGRRNVAKTIKNQIDEHKIDTSHFTSRSERSKNNKPYTYEQLFCINNIPTCTVKNRIIKDKLLEYKCAECGISEWEGKPLTLQLDHINGNNKDNHLNNLQLLCPHDHSYSPHWCLNHIYRKK